MSLNENLICVDTVPMPVTHLVKIDRSGKSLDQYANEYLAGFLNPLTRKNYASDLRHFLKGTGGNLSDESILVYRELLCKGTAARTAARRLNTVKGFLDSLVEKGALTRNPLAALKRLGPKVDKYDNHAEALTDDEVVSLIEAAGRLGESQRMALILSFSLALRVSEICSIRIQDISHGVLTIIGKGSKKRELELSEELISEIAGHLVKTGRSTETDGFLLVGRESGNGANKVSPVSIFRWVKEAAELAGITKRITTHTGRAQAITKLLDSGVPIRDVANMAGHSSISTTSIYDRHRHVVPHSVTSKIKYRKGD
jgi:integrase/recombinase XerD